MPIGWRGYFLGVEVFQIVLPEGLFPFVVEAVPLTKATKPAAHDHDLGFVMGISLIQLHGQKHEKRPRLPA